MLPGETLRLADGHVLDRAHVAALPEGGPETITEEAALARLDRALMHSVDLHQRSDVPYGMFLSGGIDSSAVLAVMARLNNDRVLAFTAGFDAPGAADERANAAEVARAAGARHETIEITRGDGLAAPAGDRRLHGRPGGRLRHHPELVPRPPRPAGRQGGAVRRGRRRDLRRLWPLSQRDAAVVAGRPGHARARHVRPAGRPADATR